MSTTAQRTITVGYYLLNKKHQTHQFAFVQQPNTYNGYTIQYRYIDMYNIDTTAMQQYQCDVLVYKVTDIQVAAHYSNNAAAQQCLSKIHLLTQYLRANDTVVVSDLDDVSVLLSRSSLYTLCTDLDSVTVAGTTYHVTVPEFHRFWSVTDDVVMYPIVVKTEVACGTPASHLMYYTQHINNLTADHIAHNTLCQQYIPHQYIHKVYVLGNDVFCYIRSSLNVSRVALDEVLQFDSQQLSKEQVGSADQASQPVAQYITLYQQIAKQLARVLRIDLFGFDVILGDNNTAYIVDVNYLPSYKEVFNFSTLFNAYVVHKYERKIVQ